MAFRAKTLKLVQGVQPELAAFLAEKRRWPAWPRAQQQGIRNTPVSRLSCSRVLSAIPALLRRTSTGARESETRNSGTRESGALDSRGSEVRNSETQGLTTHGSTTQQQDRPGPSPPRQRLQLGRTRRRLKYEQQLRIWLTILAVPGVFSATVLCWEYSHSLVGTVAAAMVLAVAWAIAASVFFEQCIRPLQTLSNVVAAMREDDFSFRARGAHRGDSLGDLALEINALAGTLQNQRSSTRDALTLVERVLTSMQSPVLAFDSSGALRLLNPAAESAFHLKRSTALGRTAAELKLLALLKARDEALYASPGAELDASPSVRWSVRRSSFRLRGVPHTLLVLSDVAAALREEERQAWQRLIRVLSHEINNSLTPIKSLAGSLRTALPLQESGGDPGSAGVHGSHPAGVGGLPGGGLHRGLTVIEERADALNRFLQSYQQLTRLPPPDLQRLSLAALLDHAIQLETRVPIYLEPGPAVCLLADPGQLQQLTINLLRNAAEAALGRGTDASPAPKVSVSWTTTPLQVVVRIRDNGSGLMNPSNLFVPFYTTKPQGSGIGLVLAQQIAYAHKGSINLANNPDGAGCTAEVRLPYQQEA